MKNQLTKLWTQVGVSLHRDNIRIETCLSALDSGGIRARSFNGPTGFHGGHSDPTGDTALVRGRRDLAVQWRVAMSEMKAFAERVRPAPRTPSMPSMRAAIIAAGVRDGVLDRTEYAALELLAARVSTLVVLILPPSKAALKNLARKPAPELPVRYCRICEGALPTLNTSGKCRQCQARQAMAVQRGNVLAADDEYMRARWLERCDRASEVESLSARMANIVEDDFNDAA